MDKDGQGSCIPASEMVRAVLISSGRAFDPIIEFHIGALSLVPRGDFPCLSRQLDSMQAKKGPGGPFAVLASPFIAEPALPE